MSSMDRLPIAIVGMGCRFPGGASNLVSYWRNLLQGVDAIVDVPTDRWDHRRYISDDPARPGKSYARQGGFLQEPIDRFDPMFFGIPPREAECMDPQQRLLLEVAWEAMEDAGLPIDVLRTLRTGVFVGGFTLDNMILQLSATNRGHIDANTATSSSMAVLANRISHIFDFRGPSIAMDTACSSSLVATHVGCQSLRTGEADVALVGGVNVMLLPGYPVSMSKGRFLSHHSRCKAFDADAAGYTRGEGAGIVVLRRLDEALENGDRIYAVIEGTGVNQDGHTTGIALPNGEAQEALMRDVYERAGVRGADIGFFEAHGTGTQAGDRTEAGSLQRVLSEDRAADGRCWVGSVKSQIGHLEAAAGVAALIKTSLCLHHRTIAPNLHFETPNPEIDFASGCLAVPTTAHPWDCDGDRLAGINSFGYGGTNAHAVLRQAPESTPSEAASVDGHFVLPLSARGDDALRETAERYVEILDANETPLSDLLHSATTRRSHLSHRLAVAAADEEELRDKLVAFADGQQADGVVSGSVREDGEPAKLAFVFTGMGPQWAGMGRALYEAEPVFHASMDRFDALFQALSGWSLLAELRKPEEESRVSDTDVAQPANLLLQMALTDLLTQKGIRPDAVVGHSVGEVAAAWAAGALSTEDAVTVIFHRSRLQRSLADPQAGMLAAGLSLDALEARHDVASEIDVAAVNSPQSVTLSGDATQLKALAATLEDEGVFNRFLTVEVAYHSRRMEDIRTDLHDALVDLSPRSESLPLYSTVEGKALDGTQWGAAYWWRNVRQPVLFGKAVETLSGAGVTHFLEVGPHPVLGHSIKETLGEAGAEGTVAPTLNRRADELSAWSTCLGQLFALGHAPDWSVMPGADGARTDLPTYPWQRERYWRESEASRQDRVGTGEDSVFLYRRVPAARPTWEVEFNEQFFPFAPDHQVQGRIVFPGAAYVAAGLALHETHHGEKTCLLEGLRFESPLVYDVDHVAMVCSQYDPETHDFAVFSHGEADAGEWTKHASGHVCPEGLAEPEDLDLVDLRRRFATVSEASLEDEHQAFEARGLHYTGSFRILHELYKDGDETLARLQLDDSAEIDAFGPLHPAILDGTFQMLLTIVGDEGRTYVPASIRTLKVHGAADRVTWSYGRITHRGPGVVHGDLYLFDDEGQLLFELLDLQCRALSAAVEAGGEVLQEMLYEPTWEVVDEVEQPLEPRPQPELVFASGGTEFTNDAAAGLLRGAGLVETREPAELAAADLGPMLRGLTPRRISYLWGLQACQDPARDLAEHAAALTSITKAVVDAGLEHVELDIITRDAQSVADTGSNAAMAALWNLGRVIDNETPSVAVSLFDLNATVASEAAFASDWSRGPARQLWAYRDGDRFTRQLVRTELDVERVSSKQLVDVDEVPVAMEQATTGDPGSLHHVRIERRAPGEHEVEIRVEASALNFKDLLKVYGRLDADITHGTYLGSDTGSELTGTVLRVGEGVTHVQPGDEVIATEPGAFRSYITIPDTYVVPKPASLTFDEAPVMVNFLTAYHGLENLGQLAEGERVLLHNAAGGVGLAAIQLARWKGAEIYATAGTDEKRDYLKSLGIERIYDSRSVRFAEQIRQDTEGYGVDVVLSAQADEALLQSFELLAPYGRYVEIGKKNIANNSGLPMRAFNRSLTFAAFDLDHMFVERPQVVQRLLREVGALFDEGVLQSLPVKVYDAAEVADAFRLMATGQHMGKIVVRYRGQVEVAEATGQLDASGSYLVTGGTRGFGLAVGEWLAARGAGQVVLVSRSGASSDEATAAIESMRGAGAMVRAQAVDVTDQTQVEALVAELQASEYPLRGIVHSAMVLDDGMLSDMTAERYRTVIEPKVAGAVNLDRATSDVDLEFFVSFSSVSSVVGNPGQANYVVANGYLDALAHDRRRRGLPALTVNWGALSDTGVVSRTEGLEDLLERAGIRAISSTTALAALEQLLAGQAPAQVGVFDVDWSQWAAVHPELASTQEFADLASATAEEDTVHAAIVEELLQLEAPERQALVQARIAEQIATVLKCPADRVDLQQSVTNLGVDSLMAVELAVLLKKEIGVEVTTVDLLGDQPISRLADQALRDLVTEEDELLEQIDDMSEEELDRILAAEAAASTPSISQE